MGEVAVDFDSHFFLILLIDSLHSAIDIDVFVFLGDCAFLTPAFSLFPISSFLLLWYLPGILTSGIGVMFLSHPSKHPCMIILHSSRAHNPGSNEHEAQYISHSPHSLEKSFTCFDDAFTHHYTHPLGAYTLLAFTHAHIIMVLWILREGFLDIFLGEEFSGTTIYAMLLNVELDVNIS